jgi:glycosyltransferase involved in cell wall biosynthesis
MLIEPGNYYDLADKIVYLWNNKTLCRKMGLEGRQKIMNEYNEDIYHEQLSGLYREIIHTRR